MRLILVWLIGWLASANLPADEFPEEWADNHEEAVWYNQTVDSIFNRSTLGISDDGMMILFHATKWHRGTTHYKNGVQRLSRTFKQNEKIGQFLGDGIYCLIMQGHTGLSYCFSSNPVNYRLNNGVVDQVRIPKADDIETFPNPWYFGMADYLSWKQRNRFDMGDKNPLDRKVELDIDNETGEIRRSQLTDEFESCLYWLVYRDGKLTTHNPSKGKLKIKLEKSDSGQTEAFTVLVVAESGDKKLLVSPLGQYCHTKKTGWVHLPFREFGKERYTWKELGM